MVCRRHNQGVPTRIVLLVAACALLAAACGPVVELEPIGSVRLDPPQLTSRVVAADGTLLAELHAEQDRELVGLDRIAPVLRDAVIAVEDARFYSHGGVDARAVARAIAVNARTGRVRQGGSTITQQLAKNAVVGDDPTLERKLQEAAVALQLERQYSKDEILERYLNTVYFGNGAYGVATAAERYFGVRAADLTLPQAALLAGLLKAPATYDPHAHPDAARARRNLVLRLMARHGMVESQEADRARDADLGVVAPRRRPWRAPWFVDHVLALLQHDPAFDVLGDDPAARAFAVFRGGLRIETTLDPEWQESAERAIAATLRDPDDPHAALVALDPSSGGIRALVGGRVGGGRRPDPFERFNLATDGRRQPGSTFKTLVLATALSQGHTLDERFPGGRRVVLEPRPGEPTRYAVRNYDDRYFGPLTLRDATAHSVNAVYARLMGEVGPEAVVATARAMGIRSPMPAVRSLALGTAEVSPLEMAAVQATLAAGGVYRAPFAVTRITGPDGDVLYRHGKSKTTEALDPAVAYLTTEALRGVLGYGTGQRADLQRPAAGKTGTTQNGADAWFTGYTPDLAAAVWVGFPQGAVPMEPPRTRIRVEGGNWPAEIFGRFGLRALAEVPAQPFERPDVDLVTVQVDGTRNCRPNPYTPPELVVERSYVQGTEPTAVCREPTGPPTADVPAVVGLPVDAAVQLLEGAGYEVERAAGTSATLPPGYVIDQDPPPGRGRLEGGRTVRIWVSVTDRVVAAVPDVVGLDVEDARIHLEAAGFAVDTEQACPAGGCAELGPAEVWRQVPAGGEVVAAHSVVTVTTTPP